MKFRYSGQAPPSFILHYFETCSTAQLKWIFFVLQTDKALSRLQRHKSLQQNTTCTIKQKLANFAPISFLSVITKIRLAFYSLQFTFGMYVPRLSKDLKGIPIEYTNVFLFIFSTESKKTHFETLKSSDNFGTYI